MRFIIDKSESAAFNMAADIYLLEQDGGVTVRFYSWERACITIGYMQKAGDELDLPILRDRGVDWIRRVTGGRAVLHEGDITYSCVFPKSMAVMGGSIAQTYRLISKCLMAGLSAASIDCGAHDSELDIRGIPRDAKLPCFLAPSRDEIMTGGRKLIGSAQKRTAEAVLQHGSIPVTDAYRKLPEYLNVDASKKEALLRLLTAKSCCVNELILGGTATFEYLAKHLMGGFSSVLPFESQIIPWSAEERRDIESMMRSDDFITRWMTP